MKAFLLFCSCFTLLFARGRATVLSGLDDSLLLLTPGCCGTHLTKLHINVLTKRPLLLVQGRYWIKPYRFLGLMPDPSKKPYYHSHFPSFATGMNKHNNQLIVVLRNYKEWLVREAKAQMIPRLRHQFIEQLDLKNYEAVLSVPHRIHRYYDFLKLYDAWDADKRLLLFYEDFIQRPKKVLSALQQFLQTDPELLGEQMQQIESLKPKLLNYYHRKFKVQGGSSTKGKVTDHFHTKNLPTSLLQRIDDLMRSKHPKLFDKYLKHYKEQGKDSHA